MVVVGVKINLFVEAIMLVFPGIRVSYQAIARVRSLFASSEMTPTTTTMRNISI